MARPKSEETKAREEALAKLPVVDFVEALTHLVNDSIWNQSPEYVQGAQVALDNFKETFNELRNKFDNTLSARRVIDPAFMPGVNRFRKERDNTPKSVKPTALQMLGLSE